MAYPLPMMQLNRARPLPIPAIRKPPQPQCACPTNSKGKLGMYLSGMGMYLSENPADSTITINPLDSSQSYEKPWYQGLYDIIPAALQYDQQRKLMDLNAKLIAQGKEPVSGEFLAAQVNVGMAKSSQQIALLAVSGAILVGVLFAMRGGRRAR